MDILFYIAIATVALIGVAGVAVFGLVLLAAGTLYGENKAKAKWIVENTRRERRQARLLTLWQNKTLERSGAGPLIRPDKQDQPPPPARRFVTPTQAVAEMKKNEQEGRDPNFKPTPPTVNAVPTPVPTAIKSDFLKDAAPAAHFNSGHQEDT